MSLLKIKLIDRLLTYLCGVVTVAAGTLLIVTGGLQLGGVTVPNRIWRWVCFGLGALCILAGFYLFCLSGKYRYRKKDFVVLHQDTGDMCISIKAIEGQVKKCVDMHEEIRLLAMGVFNRGRDGVAVDMKISLANNISIPLAVASLQKQIKQYLVASSGIDVKDVRVSVETTKGEVTNESPYQVAQTPEETESSAAAEKTEAEAEPEKKLPLHQRLFKNEDEPVTVPEAEAAAEEKTPKTAEISAEAAEKAEEPAAVDEKDEGVQQ